MVLYFSGWGESGVNADHSTEILQDVKVVLVIPLMYSQCTSTPGENSHKECLQKEYGEEPT